MIAVMHVVNLGVETTTPPEGQKGEKKYYGIFHQPESGDNSPIRVRIQEGTKLDRYKPYVLECTIKEWEMNTGGQYRSGVAVTATKVTPDKVA